MSRSLWFAAGAGAGMWAMTRARRAAEALTADGLRDRLHALDLGARLVAAEVEAGRAEKETELRRRLGLAPDPTPALEGPAEGAAPPETTRQEGSS
jgi:hypothetical protein